MSLSKSKLLVFKQLFTFSKARCSIHNDTEANLQQKLLFL
jgi:hypothetical protein